MSLRIDITKRLGDITLDMHFQAKDELVGLFGASGSGKSMTLLCIAGLVTPDAGMIELNGRTLFDSHRKINVPPRERRVGLLFQSYALFPRMTVEQNIASGLMNSRLDANKIKRLMEMLQLGGLERRYPRQLSGGQQQRVALARMLASNPELIMLDEPFSALDNQLKQELEDDFLAAIHSFKGTALYISHSIEEIHNYCTSTVVIENGHVIEEGITSTIITQPKKIGTAKLLCMRNMGLVEWIDGNTVKVPAWGILFSLVKGPSPCTHIVVPVDSVVFSPLASSDSLEAVVERTVMKSNSVLAYLRFPKAQDLFIASVPLMQASSMRKGSSVRIRIEQESILMLNH